LQRHSSKNLRVVRLAPASYAGSRDEGAGPREAANSSSEDEEEEEDQDSSSDPLNIYRTQSFKRAIERGNSRDSTSAGQSFDYPSSSSRGASVELIDVQLLPTNTWSGGGVYGRGQPSTTWSGGGGVNVGQGHPPTTWSGGGGVYEGQGQSPTTWSGGGGVYEGQSQEHSYSPPSTVSEAAQSAPKQDRITSLSEAKSSPFTAVTVRGEQAVPSYTHGGYSLTCMNTLNTAATERVGLGYLNTAAPERVVAPLCGFDNRDTSLVASAKRSQRAISVEETSADWKTSCLWDNLVERVQLSSTVTELPPVSLADVDWTPGDMDPRLVSISFNI